MARFIVRRLVAMVAVLFAISVITFLIFNVIPNGDPAVPAGRQVADAGHARGDPQDVRLRQAVSRSSTSTR